MHTYIVGKKTYNIQVDRHGSNKVRMNNGDLVTIAHVIEKDWDEIVGN